MTVKGGLIWIYIILAGLAVRIAIYLIGKRQEKNTHFDYLVG